MFTLLFQGGSPIGSLLGIALLLLIIFIPVMFLIRRFGKQANARQTETAKSLVRAVLGSIIGAAIGFFLRPSAPVIGQLPFETVITRGANLAGMEQLLISVAQASFNYLIVGASVGALIGFSSVSLLKKTRGESVKSDKVEMQKQVIETKAKGSIAEHIKELAELRDGGLLTEEEFQSKKNELLSRI